MPKMPSLRECQCTSCQQRGDSRTQRQHHQMIVLQSRLNEPQRRWFAAVEAQRIGEGGVALVSQITGLDAKTIKRGMEEMAQELAEQPEERQRHEGGGRPLAEKKAAGVDDSTA